MTWACSASSPWTPAALLAGADRTGGTLGWIRARRRGHFSDRYRPPDQYVNALPLVRGLAGPYKDSAKSSRFFGEPYAIETNAAAPETVHARIAGAYGERRSSGLNDGPVFRSPQRAVMQVAPGARHRGIAVAHR